MTPEQFTAITEISQIIAKIGTWPVGSLFVVVVFGPWVVMVILSRTMEKRHEAALRMYETNVKMVEKYEQVADSLADQIRLSTAASTELTTFLKTKTPCHQLMAANIHAQLRQAKGAR